MEKLISDFSIGLFFWHTLIFLLVLYLLRRLAWKPILDAIKTREQGIKDSLEASDRMKEQVADIEAKNKKILKETYQKRDEILNQAVKQSNQMINYAKEEAREEARKIIQDAYHEIKTEKAVAITELKNQVGEIALLIATKVLDKELSDEERQKQLVQELLREASLN